MAANEIHVGDIGTIFEVTVKDNTDIVDVSSASVKNFIFTKPSGSKVTKSASFSASGTDGKLRYATSASSDLDVAGEWRLQLNISLSTGTWSSDITSFHVYGNL